MSALGRVARAMAHELKMLRGAFYRRRYLPPENERAIIETFHRLYFDARAFNMTWRNTFWMGHPILKCPTDLWLYQEMIHELKPDVIVETGTAWGGSALYLGSLCDLVDRGQVLTIDLEPRAQPPHPRVTYLVGSSVAPDVVAEVQSRVAGARTVLAFLDSDHRMEHVLAELRTYAPMVTRGSYVVVEDTNLNGNPVEPEFGPGPMEAVDAFLQETKSFEIDRTKEKLYLSFNPRGYLKRIA
jgi:cephalosporin hydroxylase